MAGKPDIEQIRAATYLKHIPIGEPDECWEWTGGRDKWGYGKSHLLAHRWAYQHFVGAIPPGMFVCHSCDNPPCCNPRHLFLGTSQDNVDDCITKGRYRAPTHKTHCPQGHSYSAENLYARPDGYPGCKECRRDAVRRWQAKKRAS